MAKKMVIQPWALLYNLESQLDRPEMRGSRRAGRPRRPIPRMRVQLEMTADEQRLLLHLRNVIAEKLYPAKVTRSQVNGLALRLLSLRLEERELPADVADWPSLIGAIAGQVEV